MFKNFLTFFAIQFLAYALLCWNFRSIALAAYTSIALSELVYTALNFTLIKKVANADGWASRLGYIAGGVLGSLSSVWVTKNLFGI